MKYAIALNILLISSVALAQGLSNDSDKKTIESIVEGLVDSWKAGDGDKFASYFSADADFTVWFGLRMKGQKDIAFGHNMIFKNFYANTVWNLKVDNFRFLSEDIALVQASGSVLKEGDDAPAEPDAVPLLVFQRLDDNWKIIALQNTPYAVNEFGRAGDIRQMKKNAQNKKGN